MRRHSEWSGWLAEPTAFERDMAAALLDCEPGDEIRLNYREEQRAGEVTVRSVSDRAAITELRCTHDMVFWVVRDAYVFVTTDDARPLFVGWEGAETEQAAEAGITWDVGGERLAANFDGGVKA